MSRNKEVIMRVSEWRFREQATFETRQELQQLIEQASSLDEIFNVWFLKRGKRLGLSMSVTDDNRVSQDTVALFLNDGDGTELCSVDLFRTDIISMYPQVSSFNSFVKEWCDDGAPLTLHDDKYRSWMQSLGFIDSYTLMTRIGPRSAAMPLMVSFALSGQGVVEAHHINITDYADEDYKADLDEEGIDLNHYFKLYAGYLKNPENESSMRTMFDPFYCRKIA
jgi:hypothetical protein